MREDRSDPDRVEMVEAALERLFERRDLDAQFVFGEVREHLGIGGSGDECVEHRPAGFAEDVGRDACVAPVAAAE